MSSSSNENETTQMNSQNQNGTGTILHRMKHLLETGEQSDVEFLVGKASWDEKSQTLIPEEEPKLFKAHKIVLAGWDVFAAQFRTNESNSLNNVPIRVIDISASAFKAMLTFLYAKEASLIDSENFLEVYSAAKKYLLPVLIEKCHELAPEMLDLDNSIAIWRTAKLQEDKILIEHCLQFLDENSLDYWAKKQCKDEGIGEPTGPEKRAKLGPLINAIRFPLMSPTTFINRIVPTGILTDKEVAAMFVHYFQGANDESKQTFPLQFSAQPRVILPPWKHNKLVDKTICFSMEKKKNEGKTGNYSMTISIYLFINKMI